MVRAGDRGTKSRGGGLAVRRLSGRAGDRDRTAGLQETLGRLGKAALAQDWYLLGASGVEVLMSMPHRCHLWSRTSPSGDKPKIFGPPSTRAPPQGAEVPSPTQAWGNCPAWLSLPSARDLRGSCESVCSQLPPSSQDPRACGGCWGLQARPRSLNGAEDQGLHWRNSEGEAGWVSFLVPSDAGTVCF